MDSFIKASFWTDHRVEEQSPEIKLACLWLISNPSRDLCGFTRVSNKRFTFETGLAPEILEGACKGLPSSFVKISDGVFFAVHFIRHQFGKGGRLSLANNVLKAAARYASKLPDPLRTPFFEAYPELIELSSKSTKSTSVNEPPPNPLAVKQQGVREGKDREGILEEEGCGEKPDLPGIVEAYPRREGVAEALDSVQASIRKGADPGAILSGTRAIAAVIQQLPSGHLNAFVPSAAKFFRAERWRDDPQTWLRGGGKNGAKVGKLDLGGRRVGEMLRAG